MDRYRVKIGNERTWAIWENWAADQETAKAEAIHHAKIALRVLSNATGRRKTLPEDVTVTSHDEANQRWRNAIELKTPLLAEAGLTVGDWRTEAPWTLDDCLESAEAAARIMAHASMDTAVTTVGFELGTTLVSQSNGSVTFTLNAHARVGDKQSDLVIAKGLQIAVLATSVAASAALGPDFGRVIRTEIPASATLKAAMERRIAPLRERDFETSVAFAKRVLG